MDWTLVIIGTLTALAGVFTLIFFGENKTEHQIKS